MYNNQTTKKLKVLFVRTLYVGNGHTLYTLTSYKDRQYLNLAVMCYHQDTYFCQCERCICVSLKCIERLIQH